MKFFIIVFTIALFGCTSSSPKQLFRSKEAFPRFYFDLNKDGLAECFQQEYSGAKKIEFKLLGNHGSNLIKDDLHCDSIFVLKSKTNGFHDFISVASALTEPSIWLLWQYKNNTYTPTSCKKLKGDIFMYDCHKQNRNIEAYWYIYDHGLQLDSISNKGAARDASHP